MSMCAKKKSDTVSKHKKQYLKRVVTRWHRRIGLSSAVVIIFLVLSGIALNHIESLYKPQSFVSTVWLLNWYDIPQPSDVSGYQFSSLPPGDKASDIIWSDGTILIHQSAALFNQQAILGIKTYQGIVYIFTSNELHLYTLDGQKVESTTLATGAYLRFDQVLNTDQNNLVGLKSEGGELNLYNLDDMTFILNAVEVPTLKDTLNTPLLAFEADAKLAREFILLQSKVLTDIHSGRFFGKVGPWIIDFFSLAFLFLALSGFFLWLKRLKKKSKPAK